MNRLIAVLALIAGLFVVTPPPAQSSYPGFTTVYHGPVGAGIAIGVKCPSGQTIRYIFQNQTDLAVCNNGVRYGWTQALSIIRCRPLGSPGGGYTWQRTGVDWVWPDGQWYCWTVWQ